MNIIEQIGLEMDDMDFRISDNDIDSKEIALSELTDTRIANRITAMDIETVIINLERDNYEIPKYQRPFEWDKIKITNLIISLIKSIPIPPVYVYFNEQNAKYMILDGQQRITSIFLYFNGLGYIRNRVYKRIDFKKVSALMKEKRTIENSTDKEDKKRKKEIVIELNCDYNLREEQYIDETTKQEITFSNLSEKAQRILYRKSLNVVYVECRGSNPQRAYSEIFKLLNSGGKLLSSQEIRNGVYINNCLYDLIYALNDNNEIWRKIFGNSAVRNDMEALIRFLALDNFSIYKDGAVIINFKKAFSLASIIDEYSELFNLDENNGFGNEDKKVMAQKAVTSIELFLDMIKFPTEKCPPCSILIIEALYIALSKLGYLDGTHEKLYIDYNWILGLDLSKDLELDKSALSNKGSVEKRLKNAIILVRGKFENEC